MAFDVVPPLQYAGFEAYKKDYQEFLDQFQGTIDVEYRDLNIVATQWPLAAAWSG